MEQTVRTPKQIGAAIRRRRRLAKLSQAELGRQTGLRQATISALETGVDGVQLRTLAEVMAALGLELVLRDRTKAEAGAAEAEPAP